jgi:N-acetylneuraminic acid mutarotase
MRQAGSLRTVVGAIVVATSVMLLLSFMAATARAAPPPQQAAATASAATANTTAAGQAATGSHPRPATHPVRRACAASKVGFAACFSVVRTDVKGHIGRFTAANTAPSGYGPSDLQSAYNLPSASAGSGETVAIVDAYDDPNAEADLGVYRSQYGLPACTTANGCFQKVAQDGSTNYPSPDPGWATEISLDVDMVSAVCPNCHILLVEANDNSIQNLGTAVDEAVSLGAKYVSNSYGGSEDPSETTSDSSYYNHPGVAVTVSSGDGGYGVEYPAASQYVTAVGGTTLTKDSTVTRGWTETTWTGAGSGCSAYEAKPTWQQDTGCTNRTVADVSADADPNTGVAVYNTYQSGGWGVWGGTSVASPIIASTFALAGTPVAGTYPSSYPYADTTALNDVTSGSNGSCTPAYLCTAGTGYDGPTGNGTPDGVAAFTTGPHGTVSGTVTDAGTGKPLSGAEVDVGSQPAFTTSSGTYTLTVPVGTYTVTAKDFGYATQTASGVQVTDGQTTTESFALQTVPSVALTGTVSDGSGHGWPLYAKVSVPGTPASTYTNPANGQYTLNLPQNGAYTVQVDPVYPGYQQAQQSVQTGTSSLTQDFSVPVNADSCSALGYHLDHTGNTETFDGSTVPAGWSVVNASSSNGGWEFDDPGNLTNMTGGSGNFAVAYSDIVGVSEDTELVSPVTDMSADTSPYLEFDSDLFGWFGDTENIDVSTDGGQTWTSVWQSLGYPGTGTYDHEKIPLPMAAGKSQVQVRFHYVSSFGYWWELDNVFLGDRTCDPTPGGLIEGIAKDANTGAGVNGATVTSVSDPSVTATTAPTTGDPSIGDGFYYTFLPSGSQALTAAKSHYTTASSTVTVAADAVTPANFTLQAGQLVITPTTISQTIGMGSSATQNVTLTDTGKAPVNVKLYEQPGGFTMQGVSGTVTGAPIQRVSGTFTPLSQVEATKLGIAVKPATPSVAPYAAPWTTVANYPSAIMDNAVATDTTTGLVYSVGGSTTTGTIAAGYVYDPSTQAWTALPPMQNAREEPQAAFINGKLYVVGGWSTSGSTIPAMEIYDPGAGTWSTGASIPTAYAGASVAVLNGKMYVIGGCDPVNCGHTDVQVYDPGSNSWSTAASYPEPISWEGCGAISGKIYCAGGTAGSSDTADAYAYDPSADSWTTIAKLPIDLWAMGYTAANGQLQVSGGVTNGFNTVTNQGYSYDPSAGTWTALPNSNNSDYRGGSACGFYRVGGSTGGFSPHNFAEQLPGYASCGVTDVPWLSESVTDFTVNPGQTVTMTVTLNAADPSVTQPGAYTAALQVGNDTPYKVSPINLTMNATPPKTWGKITGTISGLSCNGTTTALKGATVQIDTSQGSFTLKTDPNGLYAIWMNAANNPLTVIAALDGWQPQTAKSKIIKKGVVTLNFTLKSDQVCT